MSVQNKDSAIEEQFKAFLEEAVEKVKSEEDPILLNEYKKLYKKYVPFSLRTYVAAFLTKELATSGVSFSRNSRRFSGRGKFDQSNRRDSNQDSYAKTRGDRAPGNHIEKDSASFARISIDADKATTIFIGMGRNRGVYARDIIGLLTQRASIERERIGEIKVLDNYSFVQVYIEDADGIISSINGSDYRNRKLAVSYAHKKEKLEGAEESIGSDSEV